MSHVPFTVWIFKSKHLLPFFLSTSKSSVPCLLDPHSLFLALLHWLAVIISSFILCACAELACCPRAYNTFLSYMRRSSTNLRFFWTQASTIKRASNDISEKSGRFLSIERQTTFFQFSTLNIPYPPESGCSKMSVQWIAMRTTGSGMPTGYSTPSIASQSHVRFYIWSL